MVGLQDRVGWPNHANLGILQFSPTRRDKNKEIRIVRKKERATNQTKPRNNGYSLVWLCLGHFFASLFQLFATINPTFSKKQKETVTGIGCRNVHIPNYAQYKHSRSWLLVCLLLQRFHPIHPNLVESNQNYHQLGNIIVAVVPLGPFYNYPTLHLGRVYYSAAKLHPYFLSLVKPFQHEHW